VVRRASAARQCVPPGEEGTESQVGLAGGYGLALESEYEGVRRTVSENGERAIFETHEGSSLPFGIYLRDVARGETVLLPASNYMTASKDASRVFFLKGSGRDLEVFEVTSGASEPLAGKTVDLTVDPHAGEAADVTAVLGASDDGSYVYFATGGALTPNATHGECAAQKRIRICEQKRRVQRVCAPRWCDEPGRGWLDVLGKRRAQRVAAYRARTSDPHRSGLRRYPPSERCRALALPDLPDLDSELDV
jgi:hypothetical protein